MSFDDMMEIVDAVTTMCVEKICIVYDEQLNKLKFFTCGEWKSRLFNGGVKHLMRKIQEHFFDYYESYLLRKILNDSLSPFDKVVVSEHLETYYKFIACFDMPPFVATSNDSQIVSIQDTWYPKYKKAKAAMTECNKIIHAVKDVIKRNSRNNFMEINKSLLECREKLI
jgi:hypothetical protein